MNVVLKGGTNRPHGSLFEFVRNDKFDARNFFAPDKNKLRRNQFGGTLSGPVWLPRLYDGRNRTFFLFSWESFRNVSGGNQLSRVPTELERQGDFSQTVDVNGRRVAIKDPLSGNAVFPGNRIPDNRFHPISLNILPYWPLPNRPGQANNYVTSAVNTGPWNSYLWKFDQAVSASESVSFRYQRRDSGGITPFGGSPLGTFGITNYGLQHLVGFNATHQFPPHADSGVPLRSEPERQPWPKRRCRREPDSETRHQRRHHGPALLRLSRGARLRAPEFAGLHALPQLRATPGFRLAPPGRESQRATRWFRRLRQQVRAEPHDPADVQRVSVRRLTRHEPQSEQFGSPGLREPVRECERGGSQRGRCRYARPSPVPAELESHRGT